MPTKALFPYVAELVLRKVIEQNPNDFLKAFNKQGSQVKVFAQIGLELPHSGFSFDPLSRIDIGLLIDKEIIPLEVKVGNAGLSVKQIRSWLQPCPLTKKGTQVGGKMLAILERNFQNLPNNTGNLHGCIDKRSFPVSTPSQTYPVTQEWGIIARRKYIDNWKTSNPFSQNVRFFSVEDICKDYTEVEFNKLVKKMLTSSKNGYFKDWNLDK